MGDVDHHDRRATAVVLRFEYLEVFFLDDDVIRAAALEGILQGPDPIDRHRVVAEMILTCLGEPLAPLPGSVYGVIPGR